MFPYSPLVYLGVAFGGALGALCRFSISSYIAARSDSLLPPGTFVVNLLGAFLIGLLIVLLEERFAVAQPWRAFFIAGLLGSLTTFSTFSLELVQLAHAGHWLYALGYVLLSVALCFALVMAGIAAARLVF